MPRGRHVALIAVGALTIAALAGMRRPHGPDSRLLFTGDLLLSREVKVEIDRIGASPRDSVMSLFKQWDWVAGNIEGAIGSENACRVLNRSLCFAAPETTPALLARAGFNAVSIENNHAGDIGADGRARTRTALRSAGILGLDFARSPGDQAFFRLRIFLIEDVIAE